MKIRRQDYAGSSSSQMCSWEHPKGRVRKPRKKKNTREVQDKSVGDLGLLLLRTQDPELVDAKGNDHARMTRQWHGDRVSEEIERKAAQKEGVRAAARRRAVSKARETRERKALTTREAKAVRTNDRGSSLSIELEDGRTVRVVPRAPRPETPLGAKRGRR